MLKVSKICKYLGGKKVLDNVSFEISSGTVVGLLGPNGAGKTTLMRVLVGYFEADEGQIYWDNKIVDPVSLIHKKRIGYLPENNPLYNQLSVKEYIEYMAELKNIDQKEDINKVLEECGLAQVLGQKIETLSKGYKQRVGLAAAILGNPELLILDEPTTGLDPNQIIEIRKLIKNLSKKRIVILSTHILPEAKAVCGKLLLISQGKIVLNKSTKMVKNLEKKFVELTI